MLTDIEKRILFAALDREMKICEEIDKEKNNERKILLVPVVKSLFNKFMYDRYEKKIKKQAYLDFSKNVQETCEKSNLSVKEKKVIEGILAQTSKKMDAAKPLKKTFIKNKLREIEKSYDYKSFSNSYECTFDLDQLTDLVFELSELKFHQDDDGERELELECIEEEK